MYSVTPMDTTCMAPRSPLGHFLRDRVDKLLQTWETTGATAVSRTSRETLQRFLDALDELSAATKEIIDGEEKAEGTARRPCVLVCTDDAAFAAALQQGIAPEFDVEITATPEQALQSAFSGTPDVLVTCGDSSLDSVRRLREVQPGLPAIVAAADRDVSRFRSAFANDPVILLRTPGTEAVSLAVRALLDARKFRRRPAAPLDTGSLAWDPTGEPRSYAHLAGLLPRALERAVDFDVGAGVIARAGSEPIVDVYARSHCPESTLERVREHARALFRLVAGGSSHADVAALAVPPAPLRSSIHVPLATQGRVVGLTYLASFQADAFSSEHERVLAALATYASTGYRNVESSLSRLRLTPRQSQVLALVAAGLSDKEVGERLGLAHRTVRTHLDRLLREHGFRSRTEAVAAWLRGQHA